MTRGMVEVSRFTLMAQNMKASSLLESQMDMEYVEISTLSLCVAISSHSHVFVYLTDTWPSGRYLSFLFTSLHTDGGNVWRESEKLIDQSH